MAAMDALGEGLGRLLRDSSSRRSSKALAVVLEDDAGHALLVVANALGVAAYRGPKERFPAAVESSGELDLESDPAGFVERRLLLTGFSEDLGQRFGMRWGRALVLPEFEPGTAIVLGTGESEMRRDELDAELGTLAGQVTALLRRGESTESQLDRLRRL